MEKKVVIFDFDGVIVDSLRLAYSINKEMMPDLEFEEWQSWFEGNVYKRIREEHANDNSQDNFFEKYNAGVVNLLPVDGMSEVVRKLAEKYTLVVISSSTEKSIAKFLEKYGLSNCFQDILGRETHKAKVDKFHIILEKYNIQPKETLIITDSVGDIKEANEVGVRSVGVIWGVHNAKKLKEVNPHFIATKPSEVVAGVDSVMGL
jgi:phosphoglycolate phosphatase